MENRLARHTPAALWLASASRRGNGRHRSRQLLAAESARDVKFSNTASTLISVIPTVMVLTGGAESRRLHQAALEGRLHNAGEAESESGSRDGRGDRHRQSDCKALRLRRGEGGCLRQNAVHSDADR